MDRIMRFLGLIELARRRSFGCACPRLNHGDEPTTQSPVDPRKGDKCQPRSLEVFAQARSAL